MNFSFFYPPALASILQVFLFNFIPKWNEFWKKNGGYISRAWRRVVHLYDVDVSEHEVEEEDGPNHEQEGRYQAFMSNIMLIV